MSVASPSDHLLLRRFRDGQADAPTLLYRRYAVRLRALAARQSSRALAACVDPDDVVQSVFGEFFHAAAEGRYDVPEGKKLWRLLRVITLNKIRSLGNFHRAARRDMRRTVRGEPFVRAVETRPCRDELAVSTLRLVIEELLQTLPACDRSVVAMRIEGHGSAEIAARTHRSLRAVERVLQAFCLSLKKQIGERARIQPSVGHTGVHHGTVRPSTAAKRHAQVPDMLPSKALLATPRTGAAVSSCASFPA